MKRSAGTMNLTLVVSGKSIDAAELTAAFGREPTAVRSPRPEVAAIHPSLDRQTWQYRLEGRPHCDLSDAVDELLAALGPGLDAGAAYCRSRGLALSVQVSPIGPKDRFVLGFERPETIHALARLNATFFIRTENLSANDAGGDG